jgi:hypothetical protein
MNFHVGLYPHDGLVVGANWSKTDYLEEDIVMHTVQFALFVVIVEITWDSSQY